MDDCYSRLNSHSPLRLTQLEIFKANPKNIAREIPSSSRRISIENELDKISNPESLDITKRTNISGLLKKAREFEHNFMNKHTERKTEHIKAKSTYT